VTNHDSSHQINDFRSKFVLKPSKFKTPLDQPVLTPTSQKVKKEIKTEDYGKRKALSPSKDDLEGQLPRPKVIAKAISPSKDLEERPKRNIARINYKLLHEKGIRRDKSPEYWFSQ